MDNVYNTIMAKEREFVSQFTNTDGLSNKAIDALFDRYATDEYQAAAGKAYAP